MTAKSVVSTVILFEDEIRLAARSLTAFLDFPKDGTDEEHEEASRNLLNAVAAALSGADNEDAVLLLGRKTDMMLRASKV